ncbi:hypothetical protein G9A89_005882 [Geosiphon pyriformis]|nr:hypothetical protein G9A89_005882 [Geosiphon pyriformis]
MSSVPLQQLQQHEFGRSMRSQFYLEEGYISLNHGSYGTYPRKVRDSLHNFQNIAEAAPDKWFRRDLALELSKARAEVAQFVNTDTNEIVFVQNTTTAINSVLKSLRYEVGDKLLFLSTIYSALRELMYFIRDSSEGKVSLIEIEVNYPISNKDLIGRIVKNIEDEKRKPNSRIKLALIDAISSLPGVVVPFQQIIPLLRKHNILSVIDGAHSIGQIPLNLKTLDPDFFATNCHKWLFTARGSAILYVPFRNQKHIHHAITSADYNNGFVNEFGWVGTQDFSSYLTISAALEFRRNIGGEARIQEYCNRLAVSGGKLIASILGTEIIGPEYLIAHMVNIRLPISISNSLFNEVDFVKILFTRYNCMIALFKHAGFWYVRASAQIYTDLRDFEYIGTTLKEICATFTNTSKL